LLLASKSTSAIHVALGREAAMRIPTACYASTSRKGPTSRFIANDISTGSLTSSTTDLDKLSNG
jgi:hypothetical protein